MNGAPQPIGRIAALNRYPVKSMAGVSLEEAQLGWHGLAGDRRFAFRRLTDRSGFPWLTASKFPRLILYRPFGSDGASPEPLPTHVRTPDGRELELGSDELRAEIAEQSRFDVELMKLKQGIFDDAPVSLITAATAQGVCVGAGVESDARRFRPNIVIETDASQPFGEDAWVGGTIQFGDEGPAVSVTMRDTRCMMINLDPDSARQDASVLKTVVGMNATNAGVYGTVVRSGTLHVGQEVRLIPAIGIQPLPAIAT